MAGGQQGTDRAEKAQRDDEGQRQLQRFGIAAHPDDSALDLARVGELLATIKQAHPQYQLWM